MKSPIVASQSRYPKAISLHSSWEWPSKTFPNSSLIKRRKTALVFCFLLTPYKQNILWSPADSSKARFSTFCVHLPSPNLSNSECNKRVNHCRKQMRKAIFKICSVVIGGRIPFSNKCRVWGAIYCIFRRITRHWAALSGTERLAALGAVGFSRRRSARKGRHERGAQLVEWVGRRPGGHVW